MRAVVLPGLDGTGALHEDFLRALDDIPCDVLHYPTDLTSYAALARHVSPQLPDAPFILIAESFSGPLALLLSRQKVPHLHGIIFIASFARRPRLAPRIAAKALKFIPLRSLFMCQIMQPIVMGRWASQSFTAKLHAALRQVPTTTLAARLAEVLTADETQALLHRTHPMLYLRARHDRLVPRRASYPFAAAGISVETVDGPHFLLQASPKTCAAYMRRFIQDIKSTALNLNDQDP